MDLDDWPNFEQAACRAPGCDPSWWFPERGESPDRARKVCAGCAHLVDCGEFGVAHARALIGVWGGLSQRERILAGRRRRVLDQSPVMEDDGGIDNDTAATFSPETVHTNGYHEPETGEVASPETAELCAVCSKPIGERRALAHAKTCGDVCAEEHRKQRRAGYEANKRARNAELALPQSEHHGTESPQAVRNGPHVNGAAEARAHSVANAPLSQPAGRDNLGPVFHALALAGATVVRVEVTIGADTWSVTRSHTNGGPP